MIESNLANFEMTLEQHPLIGRQCFSVNSTIGNQEWNYLELMRSKIDEDIALAISAKFSLNSAVSYSSLLGRGRPVSAFFTHFRIDGILVIEWGAIKPDGEAKLHDFLRENIKYNKRTQEGALLSSGHTGTITDPWTGCIRRLALFDCLCSNQVVSVTSSRFPMIATLLNNNILPITNDGYPVRVS